MNEQDKEAIQGHPRLGFIQLDDPEYEEVRQVVVAHHEYKAMSYPRKGSDRRRRTINSERRIGEARISTMAQIVAVCDIYDALASRRAYKPALGKEKVDEIMRTQFTGESRYIDQVIRRYASA